VVLLKGHACRQAGPCLPAGRDPSASVGMTEGEVGTTEGEVGTTEGEVGMTDEMTEKRVGDL